MMSFNIFKNTVLFPIIIGIVLMISCASKAKNNESNNYEILNQVQDDKDIIVGANQTQKYLPLLNGKQVGIVANQTSVIFKTDNKYTHLVDSLLK